MAGGRLAHSSLARRVAMRPSGPTGHSHGAAIPPLSGARAAVPGSPGRDARGADDGADDGDRGPHRSCGAQTITGMTSDLQTSFPLNHLFNNH